MTHRIIKQSSFTSFDVFQKEAKSIFLDILKLRIKLLGITIEDLEDPTACKHYKIGRDDKQKDHTILQTARAMGIILVEILWTEGLATITTPEVTPDYSITKLYIQSMPQKPKDEQPETQL